MFNLVTLNNNTTGLTNKLEVDLDWLNYLTTFTVLNFLGAGPTVMAITSGAAGDVFAQRSTERTEIKVANAMVKVAKDKGYPGKVYITRPVQHGAYISKADPPFSSGLVQYPGGL